LCHASLGDSDEAHRWFVRARRLAGERDGVQPTTTQERLWAFSAEILAHGSAGTDARATLARLEDEYTAAAMEGDPSTGAFVGLVAASAAASIGDVDRADAELRAARRRAHPPQFGTIVAYTEMIVARALAAQGRVAEARTVLDLADTTLIESLPLLDHARLSAETYVLAAEGRDRDAMERARAATAVAESAPVLLARDLFLLLALGDGDARIPARIRQIAETTSVPVTRVLDDRARELVSARSGDAQIGGFEAIRMGTVWGIGDGQRDWMRKIAPPPHASPLPAGARSAVSALTRREREIAMLVAEGLSNREIATRLYLSVRTVESHIYQARAKVDAPSRGDLGDLVARVSGRMSDRAYG
jgi:DNA-binding CsgD family transcriptional regulator